MNNVIRPLILSDIPYIEKVYTNSFEKKSDKIRKPEMWEMYIKKSNGFSMGIFDGNKLIGFSIAHILGNLVWFGPIGVLKSYQSHGIGSFLLDYQINTFLQQKKYYNFFLESPDSLPNINFYYKNGFLLNDIVFKALINIKDIDLPKKNKYKIKLIDGSGIDDIISSFSIDLSKELLAFLNYRIGIVLHIKSDDNQAIALIQTHSFYLKDNNYVILKYLLYEQFDINFLYSIFTFLKIIKKNLIHFSVSGNKYEVFRFIGNSNCKILYHNLLLCYTINEHLYNNIDFFSMSG